MGCCDLVTFLKVKEFKEKLAAWEADVDKIPPPILIH